MTLALGLGALGGAVALAARPSAATPPAIPLAVRTTTPVGLPARFTLGINEAVSVPQRRRDSFTPAALAAHLAEDATRTAGLGARLVRGHTGAFPPSSWSAWTASERARQDTDLWVRTVQAAGLEPILMVSPWPGNRTAAFTESYVPADLAGYTAWVTTLVERYDGDGVDDMPGLAGPVRYWEVDNEPDLKFTVPPRDSPRDVPPGSFCSPAEAATVLVATARGIRAASPTALVLNGGIYRPFAKNGQQYLRDLMAEPGVSDAVDVLALHSYAPDERGDAYAEGIATARALAGGRPVFVTETSVPSEGDRPWMTADWQARMVAVAVARGAAAGARVLLWHTLADPPVAARTRSGFERHSLLRILPGDTVEEKPAASVFRHLAGRLAEDDLTGATEDGDGGVRLPSGAILLYQGERTAPKGGVNLRDGAPLTAGAAAIAPAWLWP